MRDDRPRYGNSSERGMTNRRPEGAVRAARVLGTGSFMPERVLTNHDLEGMVDTSDEWIRERTGIRERRIADEKTASSDLAAGAARRAMADAGVDTSELDAIMVATVTPDSAFPCTACVLQAALGAPRTMAMDLSTACSGFVYGLEMARGLFAVGSYRKILLVGAECLSKIVDWTDRSTCVLLGDGAGAVVLGASEPERGVLSTVLGADGTQGKLLMLPAGGSRIPTTHETVDAKLHMLKMAGSELFKVAVRVLVKAAEDALAGCGMGIEDVDLMIPHQANSRIIDAAAKRLGIPEDKVFLNLERYGNTSAASIPIALDEACRQGRVHEGDIVLLDAFGGGLTWGASVIRW